MNSSTKGINRHIYVPWDKKEKKTLMNISFKANYYFTKVCTEHSLFIF